MHSEGGVVKRSSKTVESENLSYLILCAYVATIKEIRLTAQAVACCVAVSSPTAIGWLRQFLQ